MVQVSIICVYV